MRKNDPGYPEFLKRRIKKIQRQKGHRDQPTSRNRTEGIPSEKLPPRVIVLPHVFSFIEDAEKTAKFFDGLQRPTQQKTIKLDLSRVEILTIDALMYLIVCMEKMRVSQGIRFSGNTPHAKESRSLFKRSGFLKYVSSHLDWPEPNPDCIQITTGSDADPAYVQKIINFTFNHFSVEPMSNPALYELLLELIGNTSEHAYPQEDDSTKKWYAFVEYADESVKFTIMDIGFGIPNTMNKTLAEWIRSGFESVLSPGRSDASLIHSALNGAWRSSSKDHNRGKGLPFVRSLVASGQICNLVLLSGHGLCYSQSTPPYDIMDLGISFPFSGTLYYWEMHRDSIAGVISDAN